METEVTNEIQPPPLKITDLPNLNKRTSCLSFLACKAREKKSEAQVMPAQNPHQFFASTVTVIVNTEKITELLQQWKIQLKAKLVTLQMTLPSKPQPTHC